MTEPLLVRQQEDVRVLRLNRPHRRNALDPELVRELSEAVDDAMTDPGTAVVTIDGAGASFCAGADLFHLHDLAERGQDPTPFLAEVARCFARIEQAPKPVVARLHGHAVAGGLELALACDVVVAQTGTLIGDGHVRHELLPAAGSTVRLARKAGPALARWLILTGRLLRAEELAASGMLFGTAGPDDLDDLVAEVVAALRASAGPAQSQAKLLLGRQNQQRQSVDAALELDAFAVNWRAGHAASMLEKFVSRQHSVDES